MKKLYMVFCTLALIAFFTRLFRCCRRNYPKRLGRCELRTDNLSTFDWCDFLAEL